MFVCLRCMLCGRGDEGRCNVKKTARGLTISSQPICYEANPACSPCVYDKVPPEKTLRLSSQSIT